MELLANIGIFVIAAGVLWFFAGLLVDSVDRTARRFHTTGFTVAFFLLGMLTSMSELSVAANATINGVPEVSAGNLVGASFVILLGVVPLLAIMGRGITLRRTISSFHLQVALGIVFLPVFFLIDGVVTAWEGGLTVIAYAALFITLKRHDPRHDELEEVVEEVERTTRAVIVDGTRILFGAFAIFVAGYFLVQQTVYFAELLRIPSSLIAMLLLSIGTNIPEFVVALRAIGKKLKGIAFGDYLGSACANSLIFGVMALFNGPFEVEASEFMTTMMLMFFGFVLFYQFAKSKRKISRGEGVVLILFYIAFIALQVATIVRLSDII